MKNLIKVVGVTVVTGLVAVTVKKVVDKTNQKKEENANRLCKLVDDAMETSEVVGELMEKFPMDVTVQDMEAIYKINSDYDTIHMRTYNNPKCIAENLSEVYEVERKQFLEKLRSCETYDDVLDTIKHYQDYVKFNNMDIDDCISKTK